MFSLLIRPIGIDVNVEPGDTVLEAAARGGVDLPSACRNGTCRACICTLRQGTVDYRVAWPGLSAEEKRAGSILPCVAQPLSDLVIEQAAATETRRTPARPARGRGF